MTVGEGVGLFCLVDLMQRGVIRLSRAERIVLSSLKGLLGRLCNKKTQVAKAIAYVGDFYSFIVSNNRPYVPPMPCTN